MKKKRGKKEWRRFVANAEEDIRGYVVARRVPEKFSRRELVAVDDSFEGRRGNRASVFDDLISGNILERCGGGRYRFAPVQPLIPELQVTPPPVGAQVEGGIEQVVPAKETTTEKSKRRIVSTRMGQRDRAMYFWKELKLDVGHEFKRNEEIVLAATGFEARDSASPFISFLLGVGVLEHAGGAKRYQMLRAVKNPEEMDEEAFRTKGPLTGIRRTRVAAMPLVEAISPELSKEEQKLAEAEAALEKTKAEVTAARAALEAKKRDEATRLRSEAAKRKRDEDASAPALRRFVKLDSDQQRYFFAAIVADEATRKLFIEWIGEYMIGKEVFLEMILADLGLQVATPEVPETAPQKPKKK